MFKMMTNEFMLSMGQTRALKFENVIVWLLLAF